jgi:chitin synthase
MYQFLDADITAVFQERSGHDVSSALEAVFATKSEDVVKNNVLCINNLFYAGRVDFRKSARCQVNSWIVLAASAILAGTMLLKCTWIRFKIDLILKFG